MMTGTGRANRSGLRRHRRGLALIIALIVLAAMSLAAVALVRAVDTTTAVTGNLAFRAASIAAVDMAIEAAFAALFENDLIPDRDHDLRAQNYYASRQPGEDARGVPAVLQGLRDALPPDRVLDAGNGNTLRYLIERMCLRPGPATPANCALAQSAVPTMTATPEAGTAAPTIPLYRVSVRADGPQNTLVHALAVFRGSSPPRRMAWRIVGE